MRRVDRELQALDCGRGDAHADRLALATKFVVALHDVSCRNPASWRRISAIGARTGGFLPTLSQPVSSWRLPASDAGICRWATTKPRACGTSASPAAAIAAPSAAQSACRPCARVGSPSTPARCGPLAPLSKGRVLAAISLGGPLIAPALGLVALRIAQGSK